MGLVRDHPILELVDDHQLLRQVLLLHELRDVVDHRVHLGGVDLADEPALGSGRWCGPPFGVEREPDVGLTEELLVILGLGQEVRLPRLEIEDQVVAVATGDVEILLHELR